MNNFNFYNPVRVHFGPGGLENVGDHSQDLPREVR